jgi:hypothetical protein
MFALMRIKSWITHFLAVYYVHSLLLVDKSRLLLFTLIQRSWALRVDKRKLRRKLIRMGTWAVIWKSFIEFVLSVSSDESWIRFLEIDIAEAISYLFNHYICWFLNRLKTWSLFANLNWGLLFLIFNFWELLPLCGLNHLLFFVC